MFSAKQTFQMDGGVQCFNKKIYGYFDEDRLSSFALSSWHSLVGPAAGDNAGEELPLDAKLKLLKSNLTKFEKSLREGRIDDIPRFLKDNGLQHPLVHPDVVTAVCSYLLYLLSCHSDPVLVNSAANALSYHAENAADFAPDRAQIMAIALNMGMREEYLWNFSRDELPPYVRDNPGCMAKEQYPEPFTIQQVLGCLTELLQSGRRWTDAARDTLFSVLVAMLVDPHMEHIMMTSRVTVCLDRLLQSYDTAVWCSGSDSSKALDLVELQLNELPAEARLPVLAGLPRLRRGHELRRLAGYVYLQRTIREQQAGETEESFIDLPPVVTVGGVLSVVRGDQVGGLPAAAFLSETSAQLLSCYALLRCVDAAVGTEPLPGSQLGHLRQLKDLMNTEIDRVRDSTDETMDLRIRLKEFMEILRSKWGSMCKRHI